MHLNDGAEPVIAATCVKSFLKFILKVEWLRMLKVEEALVIIH